MIGETPPQKTAAPRRTGSLRRLRTDLPTKYPQIKALLWFNWNGNDPELSWTIDSSPSLRPRLRSIAAPRYASNEYRRLSASPIPPPDTLATAATREGP